MSFVQPLFLLALLPLAASAFWLLRGKVAVTEVPFLGMWRRTSVQTAPARAIRMPARAVMAMLLATLLAILGAAGPGLRVGQGPLVTVIVDRGIYAARFADRNDVLKVARDEILRIAGTSGPVDLVLLPGQETKRKGRADWLAEVENTRFSLVDSTSDMRAAVRRAVDGDLQLIVVVSPEDMNIRDPRLLHFAAKTRAENIGIVSLAARMEPPTQLMVTLENLSHQTSTTLRIASPTGVYNQFVQLPPRGERRNYFVDYAPSGDVRAELVDPDAFTADNVAWLHRHTDRSRLEAIGVLPPAVARMVEVFASDRKGNPANAAAVVTNDATRLAPSISAAIVAVGGSEAAMAAVDVVDHPLTRNVDWKSATFGATISAPQAGEWTPLVSVRGDVVVAVQEKPARRVFIGIDSERWPREVGFAVFWSQVFDWITTSDRPTFDAMPLTASSATGTREPGGEPFFSAYDLPWPGIYLAENGSKVALCIKPHPISHDFASRQIAATSAMRPSLTAPLLTSLGASFFVAAATIVLVSVLLTVPPSASSRNP